MRVPGYAVQAAKHREQPQSNLAHLDVPENEVSLSGKVRFVEGVLASTIPQVQHHVTQEP